jgi:hypothetical protein
MDTCCICGKGSPDRVVLLTLQIEGKDRFTVCPDDMRQAIAQSDIKPLTGREWAQFARDLLASLEPHAADGGGKHE